MFLHLFRSAVRHFVWVTESALIRQRGEGRRDVAAASVLSISLMLAGDGSGVVSAEEAFCVLPNTVIGTP